jgi:hypothetical protein
MLSSDESRVHRRSLLQVQERLLTKQSQDLIEGSALESLRDSTLSSASTIRSSGQTEMLRPQSEPKPLSNTDLVSVFKVPSRSSNITFGSASKSHLSDRAYVPRDHTVPDAVIAGQIPALLFRPIDDQDSQQSLLPTDDGNSSPGPAALAGIYSQDKRFPPVLDGSDSCRMISPRGENPVRPKSMNSPRGVTIVPYSVPDCQGNVAVDVVWRRSRSFSDLSTVEERTPLKNKSAASSYDSVAASDGSQVIFLFRVRTRRLFCFQSCMGCFIDTYSQPTKLDQSPVVKIAIVAILMAAFVGFGYFSTRYISSLSPK